MDVVKWDAMKALFARNYDENAIVTGFDSWNPNTIADLWSERD
jgi:hypothetical protein